MRSLLASPLGLLLLALALCVPCVRADQPKGIDFAHDIAPLIKARCGECHTNGTYKGSVSLDTREALLKGGAAGPAIVPGKPDESLLLEALRYESYEMPPAGQLEEPVIEGIAAWIAAVS